MVIHHKTTLRILAALLVLNVLVTIHEFGHFIFANAQELEGYKNEIVG